MTLMNYSLIWYELGYHEYKFKADSDQEAIEIAKTHDTGMGMCFDLFRDGDDYPLFNDEMWNSQPVLV